MEQANVIKKETNRELNIELLRIVAMLMVVTLHCLGNGKLLENPYINVYNTVLITLLNTFSLTANAIFLIITGYYSINKKFNLKRILTLWGKTIFYSWAIFIICNLLNMRTVVFDSIFPILSGEYWFITAYIAFYFLQPIINIVVNKLNQKQFKYLLITLIIMVGIIRVLFNPAGIFSGGILPFTLMYMIGVYIRKYVSIKPNQKYFVKYILFTAITALLYIVIYIISLSIDNNIFYSKIKTVLIGIREYNCILVIIMTILIFMKFKTITIKSKFMTKLITIISPSMFSIYLIHQSINIRDIMWLKMGIMNYADSWLMLPYILLMIISVFIACLLIDLIIRGIYYGIKKIPIINRCINKLNNRLDNISSKLNSYIFE